MRDITLEDTFYHDFTTRAFATGIPTVLTGSPVLSVLEENNATPITAGVSLSVDRASVVGLNMATIVATTANGYEVGKSYSIYISAGTVGGVSVVGEVVGQFTISVTAVQVRAALGVTSPNIDSQLSNMQSGVTSILVDTGTTLPNTLTSILTDTAEIGAAGAGLTNISLPNQTMDITGNLSGSVGSVTAEVTADVTKISGSATAADNLEASALGIHSGTFTTVTSKTVLIDTSLPNANADTYIGAIIVITSGNANGERTDITDYDASVTPTMTVSSLATLPTAGDTYVII